MLGRFGLDCGDQLLRRLQADRHAVRNIERNAIRRTAGGWRCGGRCRRRRRLRLDLATNQYRAPNHQR
jgi:hypothetical protein